MKRLILAGGGHAHLSVLRALATERQLQIEIVLITPRIHQNYSGMLPGWLAGHYALAQCQIDLQPLAQSAGARMELTSVVDMDADQHRVVLADGRQIEYDLLSLDVGSGTDTSSLTQAGSRLLAVKPLDDFFSSWPDVLAAAQAKPDYRLVVVGGGAAGVELALGIRHAFVRGKLDAQVELVASESGLLQGHADAVRQRVIHYLDRAGITLHQHKANGVEAGVRLSDGEVLYADCVIAATGASAPPWLTSSGLSLDKNRYVAVDAAHRSVSHANVFAAGDVCSRQDVNMARSGVHAVHAGPVLAANLLATLAGKPLQTYLPRRRSLYLLACGPQYAIASWGELSMEGHWVWRWKDWIDRGFIARYSNAHRQ